MRAELIKVTKLKSKIQRGYFYLLLFKGDNNKSYKTYIVETYDNYKNWKGIIELYFKNKKRILLSGLKIKKGNLIDADSKINIVEK